MTGVPRKCPSCPVVLQPIRAGSDYARRAYEAGQAAGLSLPAHGPAALVFLGLIAHAQVCHPDVDIVDYLEAYLS